MTHQDGLYGLPASSTTFGAHAWERVPLHPTHDEQPSFAASSQTLPGALGLPPKDAAMGHESATAASAMAPSPPFDQNGNRTSSASSSSSSWLRYPSGGSSSTATYNGTQSSYESNSSPPPQDAPLASVQQRLLASRRPGTAGEAPNMAASASADGKDSVGNNMRNFLVPIGSTGARQKLSILSASQRPRTAQATANASSPFSNTSQSLANNDAHSAGGGDSTIGHSNSPGRAPAIAQRSSAMQRSDSDLHDTLRRHHPNESDPSANGLGSRSSSQSTRSTAAESMYRSQTSYNDRTGHAVGTGTRSEGSSAPAGAGFSPQLAQVLASQPSMHSISSIGTDGSVGSGNVQSKKSLYQLRREASQTSLASSSASMVEPPHFASSSGERMTAHVGSHGGSASKSSGLASHPPHAVDESGVPSSHTNSGVADVGSRPRSSSSATKDFTGSLKSGLKNVFQRGNNSRASRPSTATSASNVKFASDATGANGAGSSAMHKSPSLTALSNSARESAIEQHTAGYTSGQSELHRVQHARAASSSSGGLSKAERILGIVPTQQQHSGAVRKTELDDVARTASMSSSSSSSFAVHSQRPLGATDLLQTSPIERTFESPSRPNVASGLRRPSRDNSTHGALQSPQSGARPGTAPSPTNYERGSHAGNDDNHRSKTPGAPAPFGSRRPSDASSDSTKRDTSGYPSSSNSHSSEHGAGMASLSAASISSLLDAHGRRGSAASDASTPTVRNAAGINDGARRADTSATSVSPSSSSSSTRGDSTFSAPNSSRNLSPADPDKPSVPLTSPLLASVLAMQAPSASFASVHQQKRQQPEIGRSASLSSSVSATSGGSDEAATNVSLTSTSISASPVLKPALPVKSKSRSSTISTPPLNAEEKTLRKATTKFDPETTPKIPDRKLSSSSLSSKAAPAAAAASSSPAPSISPSSLSSSSTFTHHQPADQQHPLVDPRVYVPADALKRTRRGVPVRGRSKDDDDKSTTATAAAVAKEQALAPKTASNELFTSPLPLTNALQSPLLLPGAPVDTSAVASSEGVGESTRSAQGSANGQIISFNSADYAADYEAYEEGASSLDTVNSLPTSAWTEIEAALLRFKAIPAQSTNDKGTLLRAVLLPFLALEAETSETQVSVSGTSASEKARRNLFFEWIRQLLLELQTIQTSADRGAILESIACIVESRNFSAPVVGKDKKDEQTFFAVLGHILSYAIGELNKKGVYQNTLIFSGRLLAVAFFRIEGVASKLLRALPVNRFALERVATEAQWQENVPSDWDAFKRHFPPWLHDFCFEDARSYLKMLDSQPGQSEDDDRFLVRQENVEVEMTGNWLRRWQSDDSELFFSFCRSYHRQLAGMIAMKRQSSSASAVGYSRLFFGGPGFAHLATCIHQKCLSLVHRDILSVTTLSSQKNFNPGETANVLSGSTAGKPRHLEAANRRCTAIVVDIVRMAPPNAAKLGLFTQMLGIHVKCLVKRTSLYDVQGVFCLLDWLDGVLGHMENAEMVVSDFVDVDFLLHTVLLLLKDADHALALMRTIAFCYSNFAILTGTRRHRRRFFEEILLQPAIFQKLFLSWSFTIRAYFLHLLVFRLARINDFDNPADDPRGKTSVRVVKLFSKRLDEIRRRHDELSPQLSSTDSQSDDEDDFSRFKHRPQSFVSTIRHTPSVHKVDTSSTSNKAERVLGIGMPDPVLSNKGESKAQSRAAKWLRALGGKGSSKNNGSVNSPSNAAGQRKPSASSSGSHHSTSPIIGGVIDTPPKIHNEPRGRLPRLDELDMFSDEEDDEAEDGEDDGGPHGGTRRRRSYARQRGEKDEGDDDDDDDDYDNSEDDDDDGDDSGATDLISTPRSKSQDGFEFGFEGAPGHHPKAVNSTTPPNGPATTVGAVDALAPTGEHISPDMSFDLQTPMSSFAAAGGSLPDGSASDPSQHRVSRAFSRRQSLLPGPAYSLVNGAAEVGSEAGAGQSERTDDDDGSSSVAASLDETKSRSRRPTPTKAAAAAGKRTPVDKDAAPPYARNLHIYAVQSLREYEQTVQEHDDFFSSQQDSSTPQVPRLPIQWPAMWSE